MKLTGKVTCICSGSGHGGVACTILPIEAIINYKILKDNYLNVLERDQSRQKLEGIWS